MGSSTFGHQDVGSPKATEEEEAEEEKAATEAEK